MCGRVLAGVNNGILRYYSDLILIFRGFSGYYAQRIKSDSRSKAVEWIEPRHRFRHQPQIGSDKGFAKSLGQKIGESELKVRTQAKPIHCEPLMDAVRNIRYLAYMDGSEDVLLAWPQRRRVAIQALPL